MLTGSHGGGADVEVSSEVGGAMVVPGLLVVVEVLPADSSPPQAGKMLAIAASRGRVRRIGTARYCSGIVDQERAASSHWSHLACAGSHWM